jgi:hypothetical protein
VALAGPAEAGLQQVVRGERGKPDRQRARAADQDPHDGGAQIIVGDASGHAAEVRERADMTVEKTDLILALVDPGEVTARVHQPHQEQPGLPPRPVDIDQYLEEVDLGEITRPVRQGHEDLAPLAPPLSDRRLDDRHPNLLALGHEQGVEPGRR